MPGDRRIQIELADIAVELANDLEMVRARRDIDMALLHGCSFTASTTFIAQTVLRRAANEAVKRSGMCWVMRIGGQSSGKPSSSLSSASTPPVDAPTKMILSVSPMDFGRLTGFWSSCAVSGRA